MALMSTNTWEKDLRSCFAVIRAARDNLRASERRVADYILEHPGEVLEGSITDLAQASATSEASVVRCCRALGYRGFPELKLVIARDLARDNLQNVTSAALQASDSVDAIASRVFGNALQALQDTMELQQGSQLEQAVVALATAQRVVICATEGTYAALAELQRKLQLIGRNASIQTDPNLQRVAVSQVVAGDVVVGASRSGAAKHIARALEQASQRGATTISVTSRAGSLVDRTATVALQTAAADVDVGGSTVTAPLAELCLVEALFVAVALRRFTECAPALALMAQLERPEHDQDV